MDLRDLIKKIDKIENPETGQKKRIDEGPRGCVHSDTDGIDMRSKNGGNVRWGDLER